MTVIYLEKYGISNNQESAVTTCNEKGEWTIRAVCTEVVCSNERPEHVYSWDARWWQQSQMGDTVRYSCEAGYVNTATRATCTRDGWTPNPLCREIKCTVPQIENGYVRNRNIQEYKEHEILLFECNDRYKRTEERAANCTKVGMRAEWTPTPSCEPIICKVNLPPVEGTRYESVSRNVFSPGETLKVICGEKYGISNNQESAVTTCNEKGEWTIRAVCTEVVCGTEEPEHVYSWDARWWQQSQMGETTRYSCEAGYVKTATWATCTRHGWTPNPLCREIVGCGSPPPLTDGDVKYTLKSNYSHQERVEFMCQSYHTMEGGPYRTCINGEWIGQMRCLKPCIVNEEVYKQHNITLKSDGSTFFTHDEMIEFKCARGIPVGAVAMRQRCNGGEILLPTCQ
ncbi:complement factor H-related protein 2-like [Etheostoma cragini]|uniref:complement factor H-related protein 2-like n=1 Tax=Etheostoma cragini TaxID=417921 RepID=UPI00155E89F8|nr:complement factor H-related protein 2-like [Etheostoma cragini]